MPVFLVKDPEGNEYEINSPEGTTEEQAFAVFAEGYKAGAIKPKVKAKKNGWLKGAVKQSLASAAGAGYTGLSMAAAGAAGLVGDTKGQEAIFKSMESTQKDIADWGGKEELSTGQKLAGTVATLPAQMLAMLFSSGDAGARAIQAGEDASTARKILGIETLGNAAGMALPFPGATRLAKAGSGAAINVAQDVLTKAAQQNIAQTEEGKQVFAPTAESALLSGVVGGGFGAIQKPKQVPSAKPTINVPKVTPKQVTPTSKQTYIDSLDPTIVEAQRNLNALSQAESVTTKDRRTQPVNRGDLTLQQELPLTNDIVPDSINPDQADMFYGNSVNNRATTADRAIAARQAAMEAEMLRRVQEQQLLQRLAQEKAAREQLSEPTANTLERQPTWASDNALRLDLEDATRSAEQLRQLNEQGQQMSIVEDFGNNNVADSMPGMRVDENGMPIRADLSMEVQNLENPLQRNLWGDELPIETGDGGIPLTQALDSMSPGPARDAAIENLSGVKKPSFAARKRNTGSGQGGAIDPKVFEDLYNFGKSVVRGANGLLMPVYHGTTKIIDGTFRTIKGLQSSEKYAGDLGTWFSSTPGGTDTFAGTRTGVSGGNVHQVYLNLTNPAIFNTHSEFKAWFDAQEGSTNKVRRSLIKEGYDGIVINNSATDGGGVRQDFVAFMPDQIKSAISPGVRNRQTGSSIKGTAPIINDIANGIVKLGRGVYKGLKARVAPQDSIQNPQSPETAKTKAELGRKAKAIGANNSIYAQVTTVEDAVANLGKDLSFDRAQDLGGGLNLAVRRNPSNGPLKFVRYLRTKANEANNAFLKTWMTEKGGYGDLYRNLSDQEKVDAHAVKIWLSENQVDYTPELGAQMGVTDKVGKFLEHSQKVKQALDAKRLAINDAKGLDSAPTRKGYFPSLFDQQFIALAGKTIKGEFKLDTYINAKSRAEYNAAVKMYKDKGMEIVPLGKRGRRGIPLDSGRRNQFDEVGFFLKALAEGDPKFAKFREELLAVQVERNKKMGAADKRDLVKKGVKGYKGNKPWLDDLDNAKEGLEAEIRYIEETSRSYHYQELLDQSNDLLNKLPESHAKTKDYLTRYISNIKGDIPQGLPTFINKSIDVATEYAGKLAAATGYKLNENPRELIQGINTTLSGMMLGVFNIGMTMAQSAQIIHAGLPEALRIKGEFDTNSTVTSFGRATLARTALMLADKTGNLDKTNFPKHMVDAYKHMKEVGLEDLSENLATNEILDSPLQRGIKHVTFSWVTAPEAYFRPIAYLWFTDLFHQAGKTGDDLRMAAKQATDAAMVDYNADEAPLVYNQFGILKDHSMALQKFKHNFVDVYLTRVREAKDYPMALFAAMGLSIALGGIVGLPLMAEMDEWMVKPITGKSSREHLESALGKDSSFIDGLASAYTGMDMASRFSMADVVPNSPGEALAGARLNKLYKIMETGFTAVKEQDTQSVINFGRELVPSGMRQIYDQQFLMDDNGFMLNKEGEVKYDFPRTEKQQLKSAVTGIRPIAERQEDERLWSIGQRRKKLQDKQKKARELMKRSINRKDEESLNRAIEDYIEAEGNPKNLDDIYMKVLVEQKMSERQRRAGKPGTTPSSVSNFSEYTQ